MTYPGLALPVDAICSRLKAHPVAVASVSLANLHVAQQSQHGVAVQPRQQSQHGVAVQPRIAYMKNGWINRVVRGV
jgi:hypothetical protein